jgi:hypothetical protein
LLQRGGRGTLELSRVNQEGMPDHDPNATAIVRERDLFLDGTAARRAYIDAMTRWLLHEQERLAAEWLKLLEYAAKGESDGNSETPFSAHHARNIFEFPWVP